jgi:hypothetical protein
VAFHQTIFCSPRLPLDWASRVCDLQWRRARRVPARVELAAGDAVPPILRVESDLAQRTPTSAVDLEQRRGLWPQVLPARPARWLEPAIRGGAR